MLLCSVSMFMVHVCVVVPMFMQNGDMYGHHVGDVKPEDLTHEVWDYIFLQG